MVDSEVPVGLAAQVDPVGEDARLRKVLVAAAVGQVDAGDQVDAVDHQKDAEDQAAEDQAAEVPMGAPVAATHQSTSLVCLSSAMRTKMES